MTDRTGPDREQRVLMPRSAPPPEVPAPRGPTRSTTERAARVARVRDARELADPGGAAPRAGLGHRWGAPLCAPDRRASGVDLHAHDRDAPPPPHGERVRLRDGGEIVIRQVEPEDAAQLKLGFEHLGAVSRYRRFLAPLDHLSPEQLSYLTHVDHTNHEAIAALDAVTGEGIGVARFVRDPDDARLAEVAIVVTDAWQSRGVGTALVERLAARMRTVGVERIAARMLVGSEAPRRLIAHCADTLSEQRRSGTVVLEAKLSGRLAHLVTCGAAAAVPGCARRQGRSAG